MMMGSTTFAIPFATVLFALGVAGIPSAPANAGGLREVDQTIFGMDCAPCAAGIEQGLKKLPDVTSVRVSLNEGKAVVAFGPESRTTLAQIRQVILHNGFTPKDARATFVGRLVRDGVWLWIDTGNERFVLRERGGASRRPPTLEASGNELTLTVRVPETLANPPAVELLSRLPSPM